MSCRLSGFGGAGVQRRTRLGVGSGLGHHQPEGPRESEGHLPPTTVIRSVFCCVHAWHVVHNMHACVFDQINSTYAPSLLMNRRTRGGRSTRSTCSTWFDSRCILNCSRLLHPFASVFMKRRAPGWRTTLITCSIQSVHLNSRLCTSSHAFSRGVHRSN